MQLLIYMYIYILFKWEKICYKVEIIIPKCVLFKNNIFTVIRIYEMHSTRVVWKVHRHKCVYDDAVDNFYTHGIQVLVHSCKDRVTCLVYDVEKKSHLATTHERILGNRLHFPPLLVEMVLFWPTLLRQILR